MSGEDGFGGLSARVLKGGVKGGGDGLGGWVCFWEGKAGWVNRAKVLPLGVDGEDCVFVSDGLFGCVFLVLAFFPTVFTSSPSGLVCLLFPGHFHLFLSLLFWTG